MTKSGYRIDVQMSALILASLLAVAAPLPAAAQEVHAFNVTVQDPAGAIRSFGVQAGVQILASAEDLKGKKFNPISGDLSTEEALKDLLAGTGLDHQYVGDRAVALVTNNPPTAAPLRPSGSSARLLGDSRGGPNDRVDPTQVGEKPSKTSDSSEHSVKGADKPVQKSAALEEIVVTARRREENINTVPVAITALSGDDLKRKNIATAADLQNFVPSLSVSSSVTRDDYTFAIRGMGPTGGSGPGAVLAGGGSGVVAYFAEVPTSAAGPGLFYDLENVQVAKGPQGTLFGKNTTGGVILFVPRKPTNDFEGVIDVGGGNYDMKSSTVAINVPLIDDRLLVRFAAQVQKRDGFTIDRGPIFPGKEYDNRDYWAARLSVVWRPIENVENYAIFSDFRSNEHGDGFVLSAVNPAGPFATSLLPFLAQQQAAGVRSTALSDNEIDKRYNYGIVNTTRWTISDAVQFKNIFSYQVQKWRNSEDVDGSTLVLDDLVAPRTGGWHTQVGTYTDEPQFQGAALGGNLKWTTGLYYEDGRNIAPQSYEVDVAEGNFVISQTSQTNSEKSRGAYVQTTYDLGGLSSGLDGLKLTTGYRYTADNFAYGIGAHSPSIGNACLTSSGTYPQSDCFFSSSGTSNGNSWTVGLDDQITSSTLVYVRSSRGYVPGGFNPSFGFTPGGVATPQFRFAPESAVDVELGLKSEFTIGSMPAEIDTDIFHSEFKNIQRLVSETLPGGVQSNFTANASKAQIDGFEFQGSIVPLKNLKVAVSYSYNHGKYTEIDPAAAPSLVGIPFGYLPENKASVTTTYILPLGDGIGEAGISASYSYQSKFFDAPAIQPLDYISGYGLVNLNANWNGIMHSSFDLSVFVSNATDRTYRVGQYSNYVSDGRITSFYGEPRMFGIDLRYRFGVQK
jgi:iron complex outermembrane receptor protein